MNFQSVVRSLAQIHLPQGARLHLTQMRRLVRQLDNPHHNLRFIHIAGTNGKGSTAAFCSAILQASGLRVGLYTSPHLVSIRERIQINGVSITRQAFTQAYAEIIRAGASIGIPTRPLTFFEILTAIALLHFRKQRPDWILWETGLGGRLDATNIVTPALTLITPIGYDHQEYLGRTLPKIAAEKAGIIKPRIPLIIAPQRPAALRVIIRQARRRAAPHHLVQDNEVKAIARYPLSLIGPHQKINAAVAVAAIRRLLPELPPACIRHGLAHAHWPGRFQILRKNPPIILDGAHNVSGIEALLRAWREHVGPQKKFHLIITLLRDKDIRRIAAMLIPWASAVSIVENVDPRALAGSEIRRHFSTIPCRHQGPWETMAAPIFSSSNHDPTLITGSLRLVGVVLHHLNQGRADGTRSMNEWL